MDGRARDREWWRLLAQGGVVVAAVLATAGSAILVKELQHSVQPLAAIEVIQLNPDQAGLREARIMPVVVEPEPALILGAPEDSTVEEDDFEEVPEIIHDPETLRYAQDANIRWFNGRPVRPARQMWMTVTAYSPDEQSCGPFADGLTATLHSVKVNGTKFVAADTRLLPFGSLVTVPGYDDGHIVPVLDRGGAIKGNKLDLMFPTHEEARQWGRQRLQVVIWEYADGLPPDNPRAFR